MATTKLDLYRQHKADYVAPRHPVFLTIRPAKYLSYEGKGAPSSPAFRAGFGALYGVAFTIKMTRKHAGKRDYKVAWPEGLWWGPNRAAPLSVRSPKDWRWKLLIRTPTFVTARDLAKAQRDLLAKGKVPEVARVRLETVREGRCVQMLHVGPYDKEPVTLEAMQAIAEEHGYAFRGVHHEIYLSDPRRTAPSKLRTILRHPLR